MKLVVYDFTGTTPEFLKNKQAEIVQYLRESRTYTDVRDNLRYCVNNVNVEGYIIGATLSQEYIGNLTTINPANKEEKAIADNPWEKTYFFIDIVTGKILIQKRKYSPKNLNHGKTETRIIEILSDIFLENFNSTVGILKTVIGDNNEYFKRIIRTETVKQLHVVNLRNKKIPVGTPLHNPREDLDIAWAESWNTYDSNYINEVKIVAEKEADLSRSVLQKALIAAEGDIKSVQYYDFEEDKPITITNSSQGAVNVDVKNDEEVPTIMKKSFEKIAAARDIIRGFIRRAKK
jgi:hypothetical protein